MVGEFGVFTEMWGPETEMELVSYMSKDESGRCGGDRLRLGVHNNKFYTHITSIESGGDTVSHVRGRGIRDFYGNVMLRQKRNLYPI